MSNINIDIRNKNTSSEESSVDIRVIPGNAETESPLSDSHSEPSCSSNERERTCIIKIRVETPLPRARSHNQAKGVTVRLLHSNLHRVRMYTPEDVEQKQEPLNPNEDSVRVWSLLNCMPWKFEIEIQERETNPLKRPASRPGSPQQEAGGPREASRCLNR